MGTQSFYTRQMLMQYGRQLIAARRLLRYERMVGRSVSVSERSAAEQRQLMVERVAQEVTENLIFSGSDNPVVTHVLDLLSSTRQEKILFRYPPGELDFKLYRLNEAQEEIEIIGNEKEAIMEQLWNIALQVVDATML